VLASLKPGIKDQTPASPAPLASVNEPVRNLFKKPKFLAAFETALRSTGGAENWLATIRPGLIAKGLNQDVAEFCAETARYPIIASVWLTISYGLSFTHFPPTVQYGRLTSVHLAAAFGASILVAWVCSVLLFAARVYDVRRVAIAGLALYFALVVGYGIAIQKDFQLSWEYQRSFWTNVVKTAPDLNDGTVIFALRDGLPETDYIATHGWSDPIVLNLVFRFPEDWKQAPRLFVIDGNWNKMVKVNGDKFVWSVPEATWLPHQEDLPNGNVILLKATEGGLVREYGSIEIQGKRLDLKAPTLGDELHFDQEPLYTLLIDESKLGSR
jgi:hypothetical protein